MTHISLLQCNNFHEKFISSWSVNKCVCRHSKCQKSLKNTDKLSSILEISSIGSQMVWTSSRDSSRKFLFERGSSSDSDGLCDFLIELWTTAYGNHSLRPTLWMTQQRSTSLCSSAVWYSIVSLNKYKAFPSLPYQPDQLVQMHFQDMKFKHQGHNSFSNSLSSFC